MDIIDCFVSLLVTSLEALGCVLLEAFYNFFYHVVDYISVANFLSVEFRFGLLSVDVKLCQACGAVKVFSLPAGPLKLLACEAVKVFFACGAVKVFSLPAGL